MKTVIPATGYVVDRIVFIRRLPRRERKFGMRFEIPGCSVHETLHEAIAEARSLLRAERQPKERRA